VHTDPRGCREVRRCAGLAECLTSPMWYGRGQGLEATHDGNPQAAAGHRAAVCKQHSASAASSRLFGAAAIPACRAAGALGEQRVVSVTDNFLGTQAWYNGARASKPQTFAAEAPRDPTAAAGACDFCRWRELTARDAWGRPAPAPARRSRSLLGRAARLR